MDPWNSKTVEQPPINTAICNQEIDIEELKHVVYNIVTVLSKQAPLHKESAILSRFIYKFDKKFRNDIGYRKFKKVNSTLRRYLMVDILKDLKNFKTLLPEEYTVKSYLPTRQMLEYVLVRVITFSKMMLRVSVCSKQSAIFYLNRIKRGESHWMSLMPYALLSRIWSMSLVLLQHSCNWYNRLYNFRQYLTYKGVAFLPEDYELPCDLGKWINMKEWNNEGRFNWTQKSSLASDALLIENEEGDLCENILMYVDKINSNENNPVFEPTISTPKDTKMDLVSTRLKDDLGVAISRDSFNPLNSNVLPTGTKQEESTHGIENVTNLETLKNFIQKEDKYRNISHNLSVTKHLSFMQWQSLKTGMGNFENKMNSKKLQKKLNKIWKEKCLDYL